MTRALVELGLVFVGMALLARLANRAGFSAIPLYLLAGLAFGTGGLAPLNLSQDFIGTGAQIGVLLLLFMLGLEYTGTQLHTSLRSNTGAAVLDVVLNFPPGFVAAKLLGWSFLPAVLLGGVTYGSSSGIVAKVLQELRRVSNPETSLVLSLLVLEDLAMAVYLPLVAVLAAGGDASHIAGSVGIAVAAIALVFAIVIRHGVLLSRFAAHTSDEVILLTLLGTLLLVAGATEMLHVSAPIGAFLVGIAVSGPMAEQSHRIFAPLRDLFAATFFFFFGLEIDPKILVPVFPAAIALGMITAGTKILTGYWSAGAAKLDRRARLRAGTVLVPRGEFSIVIAGLGAAIEPALVPLSAAYVLFTAVLGPILARITN
jgi:CPA2 family monovalent cation:H+ antiporter-2